MQVMRTADGGGTGGWMDVSPSPALVAERSLYDLAILSSPDEVLVVGDRCVTTRQPTALASRTTTTALRSLVTHGPLTREQRG
jgi:hypothetical protein